MWDYYPQHRLLTANDNIQPPPPLFISFSAERSLVTNSSSHFSSIHVLCCFYIMHCGQCHKQKQNKNSIFNWLPYNVRFSRLGKLQQKWIKYYVVLCYQHFFLSTCCIYHCLAMIWVMMLHIVGLVATRITSVHGNE